jgi:hypothetical protein
MNVGELRDSFVTLVVSGQQVSFHSTANNQLGAQRLRVSAAYLAGKLGANEALLQDQIGMNF